MSDVFFIILVSVVAIGVVFGIAYLLEKRIKQPNPSSTPLRPLPKLGPVGKVFLWIARVLIVLIPLPIIGAFVFRSMALVSLTGSLLGLYILNGIIYQIVIHSTNK